MKMIAEGKTKMIVEPATNKKERVLVVQKDDITAGDGARHDVIPGKGVLANQISCILFDLLRRCLVPVAYMREMHPTSFLAHRCEMIPDEIVGRFVASGSYCKRNPTVSEGTPLQEMVVEHYLKTKGKMFAGLQVPKDDPLVLHFFEVGLLVGHPTDVSQTILVPAHLEGIQMIKRQREEMGYIARYVGLILQSAWHEVGCKLIDFKIEFGITSGGKLVVADSIDPDSWRLLNPYGNHLDKEPYRKGASVQETLKIYKEAAARAQSLRWLPDSFFAKWQYE